MQPVEKIKNPLESVSQAQANSLRGRNTTRLRLIVIAENCESENALPLQTFKWSREKEKKSWSLAVTRGKHRRLLLV